MLGWRHDDNDSPLGAVLYFGALDCVNAQLARGASLRPLPEKWGRLQSWLDGDESIAVVPLAAFFPSLSDRVVAAERAIVFASIRGQSRIVRLLLDRRVNVNPPRSYWTATAAPHRGHPGTGNRRQITSLARRRPTLRDSRHQSTAIAWAGHARGPRLLERYRKGRLAPRAG